MFAAQEMFRSANRVTRAEKALILGFMAGARGNLVFVVITRLLTSLEGMGMFTAWKRGFYSLRTSFEN